MNNFLTRLFRKDTSDLTCTTGVAVGGWGNPYNGLGIPGQDNTTALLYTPGRIPSAMTVDRLYTFDWLADRIIELMPSIAMVRGFRVAGAKDGGTALIRDWEKLNTTERFPQGAYQRAVNDGRAYGGSVLLKGYALGNPASELTPEQRQGGIKFFDVIAQHELRVLTRFDDPADPRFAMPELYEVIAGASGPPHPRVGQIFHSSRAIRFAGRPLRVPNTGTDLVGDWPEIGVSVLTPVLQVLGQYGLSWAAVSNMVQDASVGVIKMAGLTEALAHEDQQIVEDRMRLLQRTKASNRTLFLDSDNNEEYSRTEVKMTDMPAVMQLFMIAVSGASGVPARIFFSSSPSGLNSNASGDADLKQLYNDCANYQRRYLGPKLEDVLTDVQPGGDEVHIEWPSLWEASDNEKAQTRVANANADKTYWDMGYGAKQIGAARARGTLIELTGETPEDTREDVAAAGALDEPATPDGAPGKEGAAKIATKQRAEQK